jgi:HD superfamily phosphodiesterase
MLNQQIVDRIEGLVHPEYEKLDCWAHAWPHIKRVGTSARELADLVGVNPFACQIAAYCHDLGRIVEQESTGKKTELGKDRKSVV